MATPGTRGASATPSPTSPTSDNENSFPQYPRQAVAGPPSIISSRMTDIASEDGVVREASPTTAARPRRSLLVPESRPGTGRTGNSTRQGLAPSQPMRRVLSNKRKSLTPSTGSGSVGGGRPGSSTGKSHVPSLTSHAFFRPMSSQKLQAQRGAARPSTMSQPPADGAEESPVESNINTPRQSIIANPNPNPIAQVTRQIDQAEDDGPVPPSRGTEMTDQETYDRMTANTSPQGHYTTGSLTESVRPLQKQPAADRNLAVNTDKSYRPGGNLPTPRSFRSGFLMPSRNNSQQSGENRDMRGGEKLESVASSPRLTPTQQHSSKSHRRHGKEQAVDLGHNYEYFDGNLVFCFGGRALNTRQKPINIGTGTLVVLPAVLFLACQASWIWHNLSPAIPITWAYIWYICISSFVRASASDPGVSKPFL